MGANKPGSLTKQPRKFTIAAEIECEALLVVETLPSTGCIQHLDRLKWRLTHKQTNFLTGKTGIGPRNLVATNRKIGIAKD
jgi:hypothetical protein